MTSVLHAMIVYKIFYNVTLKDLSVTFFTIGFGYILESKLEPCFMQDVLQSNYGTCYACKILLEWK